MVSALSAPGVAEALGGARTWRWVVCACGVHAARAVDAAALVAAAGGAPPPAAASVDAVDLPSLHVVGAADPCRPMSLDLAAAYADAAIVEHAGGHELPIALRRDAAFVGAVDAFFRSVL